MRIENDQKIEFYILNFNIRKMHQKVFFKFSSEKVKARKMTILNFVFSKLLLIF